MKVFLLMILYLKLSCPIMYKKIDAYEKIYSTNLHRTLQQSPEFVAAMSRLQQMKWSTAIRRLPEYQALKTYLTEVGFYTAGLPTFFKSLEDELLLDQFPQPKVYHRPTFQPFFDMMFSSIPKYELVEGASVVLLSSKDIGEICSAINGYYVKSLIAMLLENSTTKRMIAEFEDMDLDLAALTYFLVETVSLTCVQLDIKRD